MRRIILGLLIAAVLMPECALAWYGYDENSGREVEIHKGNLVRPGRDIEVYDPYTGRYKDVEVESIRKRGRDVEVEVYDWQTGKSQTLIMEGYQAKKQRYGR
ncbi:MAG: DUF5334 family protein [Mailhella sp.]|nr:DUF5334 family protein [Mailhella sp.]